MKALSNVFGKKAYALILFCEKVHGKCEPVANIAELATDKTQRNVVGPGHWSCKWEMKESFLPSNFAGDFGHEVYLW